MLRVGTIVWAHRVSFVMRNGRFGHVLYFPLHFKGLKSSYFSKKNILFSNLWLLCFLLHSCKKKFFYQDRNCKNLICNLFFSLISLHQNFFYNCFFNLWFGPIIHMVDVFQPETRNRKKSHVWITSIQYSIVQAFLYFHFLISHW